MTDHYDDILQRLLPEAIITPPRNQLYAQMKDYLLSLSTSVAPNTAYMLSQGHGTWVAVDLAHAESTTVYTLLGNPVAPPPTITN